MTCVSPLCVSAFLRAEMHLPEVSVRFGLMLEAYCRGCGSYMQDLIKQYAALDSMRQISQTLQKATVSNCRMHDYNVASSHGIASSAFYAEACSFSATCISLTTGSSANADKHFMCCKTSSTLSVPYLMKLLT